MQEANRHLGMIIAVCVLTGGCAAQTAVAGDQTGETAALGAQAGAETTQEAVPGSADYYGEGIQLAALRFVSWEDTVFMAKVYPVTVMTSASEESKGQAKVEPVSAIPAAKEAQGDAWQWTPFVFQSYPASKDDLVVGKAVLCVDVDYPKSPAELKAAEWRYRTISSTDDLFKGIVTVTYHDTYHHGTREAKVHMGNIRIVENPVPDDRISFPN